MPAPSESPGGRRPRQGFSGFSRRLLKLGRDDRRSWIVCARVDSTNSLARRYLDRVRERRAGPAEPCCFVAWEQTAGRGRRGRTWESPPGLGLYLTLLLPELPATLVPMLPLVTASAVARMVGAVVPAEVRVKWPNDVLSSGRKLAGILVEASSGAHERSSAIVGIGLNCLHDAEDLPRATATSLRLEGAEGIDMARVAHDVCASVDRRLAEGPSMAEVVNEYRSLSVHRRGDRIRCRQGDRVIDGRFAGFAADGSLLLERDGRTDHIRSSEIVER